MGKFFGKPIYYLTESIMVESGKKKKIRQKINITPNTTKLELDMSCHLTNAYAKFEIDTSKPVEKKSGKLCRDPNVTIIWSSKKEKIRQKLNIAPNNTKLKLDLYHDTPHISINFQPDISKHGEKKSGKLRKFQNA